MTCQKRSHLPPDCSQMTLVYRIIKSKEDQTLLQEDLDKLQEWERDWLMQFNADKCKVIRITNKLSPLIHDYHIHGTKLQTVKDAKYLGLTINSDLSWNKHVDITAKKATTSLNFLKRNLHSCPSTVKENATSRRFDRSWSMPLVYGTPTLKF